MEGIPEITGTVRVPLKVRVPAYMMDHRSREGVILPAVEIMEILADSVLSACPGFDVLSISDARFDRFIPLEQGRDELECFADIESMADGCARVKLLTRAALKRGITRTKEHASMVFGGPFQGDSYHADLACCVEGSRSRSGPTCTGNWCLSANRTGTWPASCTSRKRVPWAR